MLALEMQKHFTLFLLIASAVSTGERNEFGELLFWFQIS